MNARNIVISREQAETILDQETCDRLFAAGTDVRQVENACFRLGCLHQAESMLAASSSKTPKAGCGREGHDRSRTTGRRPLRH